jgi:hypothetical protein
MRDIERERVKAVGPPTSHPKVFSMATDDVLWREDPQGPHNVPNMTKLGSTSVQYQAAEDRLEVDDWCCAGIMIQLYRRSDVVQGWASPS